MFKMWSKDDSYEEMKFTGDHMVKRKLYMKYLVLKMDDQLNMQKLWKICESKGAMSPKIRLIAEDILSCIEEDKP